MVNGGPRRYKRLKGRLSSAMPPQASDDHKTKKGAVVREEATTVRSRRLNERPSVRSTQELKGRASALPSPTGRRYARVEHSNSLLMVVLDRWIAAPKVKKKN
ncbi:hypothetical protein V6N13_065842 [Hibiscus sabdariffa]